MVPPDSHGISRAPCYLGYHQRVPYVSSTGVLPSVPALSQGLRLRRTFLTLCRSARIDLVIPQPHSGNDWRLSRHCGLASSAFARHYSRNHKCFLFLWVLRCFTSPRSHHVPYVFRHGRLGMTPAGFPHSDIPGSQLGWQLPEAYRSLLRPSSAPDAKASTVRP